MKSSEFIKECTSAGSVAAVAMPMGKVIKREEKQTTAKSTKYTNRSKPTKVKDIY